MPPFSPRRPLSTDRSLVVVCIGFGVVVFALGCTPKASPVALDASVGEVALSAPDAAVADAADAAEPVDARDGGSLELQSPADSSAADPAPADSITLHSGQRFGGYRNEVITVKGDSTVAGDSSVRGAPKTKALTPAQSAEIFALARSAFKRPFCDHGYDRPDMVRTTLTFVSEGKTRSISYQSGAFCSQSIQVLDKRLREIR